MEIAFVLLSLIIRAVLVLVGLVAMAVVLVLSVPYILLWPKLDGRTWPGAIRARSWRVLEWVSHIGEAIRLAGEHPF